VTPREQRPPAAPRFRPIADEDAPGRLAGSQYRDTVTLQLGRLPCCSCLRIRPGVRNFIMLTQRGPVPGVGWGCIPCGLPSAGAMAVLCDGCLKRGRSARYVLGGQRVGQGPLRPAHAATAAPFEHRRGVHWPETEADNTNTTAGKADEIP
jgi:hypothetical protein